MKKYVNMLLVISLVLILAAGCTGKESSTDKDGSVDVDLTALNSTMVYGEIYNILTNANKYKGKTIKMNGPYYAYCNEKGIYQHLIIIEDASACCQQGLEFRWNGEHIYPDDYPEDNARVEVTGVFGTYKEKGETYYYLEVEDITILT